MGDDLRERVCEAALTCIARWGVAKTTLEDVAREAGCGRATIYRAFSGGKSEVLTATLARELRRFEEDVCTAVLSAGDDPEDVVVAGVVAAARFLRDHEALRYLLRHEPDVVLPSISFRRMRVLYALVADFATPFLARFAPDAETAAREGEWLARVVLSYSIAPHHAIDLADESSARRFLSTYVLPGLALASHPLAAEEPCPSTTTP